MERIRRGSARPILLPTGLPLSPEPHSPFIPALHNVHSASLRFPSSADLRSRPPRDNRGTLSPRNPPLFSFQHNATSTPLRCASRHPPTSDPVRSGMIAVPSPPGTPLSFKIPALHNVHSASLRFPSFQQYTTSTPLRCASRHPPPCPLGTSGVFMMS